MILFKKITDIQNWLAIQHEQNCVIGFVPTMGALHNGHLSLIKTSKKDNDFTVCSLFVNPAQFNDKKDFEKYPITLEKDIELLESAGCDILFLPSVDEIYPDKTVRHFELGQPELVLEGKFRPGHFQGVARVVHRLMEIIHPDRLYLGQKDYQQCMVIKQLLATTGFGDCDIVIAPTLRESDGLAMSSRNVRLTEVDRQVAPAIYECLGMLKNNLSSKRDDLDNLKKRGADLLTNKGIKVDYVEIADAATLQSLQKWDGKQKVVALIAAFLHDVRLIDNLLLN